MSIHFHEEDLPADVRFADGPIAVDTEAMGRRVKRELSREARLHQGAVAPKPRRLPRRLAPRSRSPRGLA